MKDLKFITLAQIVGCCLVVLGHSYPFVTDMPRWTTDVRDFIYVFHMPLFVFCSGYLFAYTKQTERKAHGEFVGQRMKRLLLPYVALSLVGILPKYLFASVLNESLGLNGMSLLRAFLMPRENVWGHFWFLPMIFLLGWIGFLVERYSMKGIDKDKGWGVLTMVMLLIAWSYQPTEELKWLGINDIIKLGWCYTLGAATCYWIGVRLTATIKQSTLAVAIGGGIFLTSCVVWKMRLVPTLLIAIAMITAVVLVCRVWAAHIAIDRSSLVAQTYQIFILSWPCQLVVEIITERLLHLQWWVIIPSVCCMGIVGPLVLLKMIDWFEARTKSRILSTIIGK